MRVKSQAILLLVLPLLASGCVTHKLWTASALDEWNEPAPNPNLHLFEDARRDDLLVVYNEYSERNATTRTRAFFLKQNQKPLAKHTRPRFVNVHAAEGLPPVPVFHLAPPSPPELYAVAEADSPKFTIFSDGEGVGPDELPTYNDGLGQVERVALTPVAATADVAIVSSVLGCCWCYMLGNGDFQWRP